MYRRACSSTFRWSPAFPVSRLAFICWSQTQSQKRAGTHMSVAPVLDPPHTAAQQGAAAPRPAGTSTPQPDPRPRHTPPEERRSPAAGSPGAGSPGRGGPGAGPAGAGSPAARWTWTLGGSGARTGTHSRAAGGSGADSGPSPVHSQQRHHRCPHVAPPTGDGGHTGAELTVARRRSHSSW